MLRSYSPFGIETSIFWMPCRFGKNLGIIKIEYYFRFLLVVMHYEWAQIGNFWEKWDRRLEDFVRQNVSGNVQRLQRGQVVDDVWNVEEAFKNSLDWDALLWQYISKVLAFRLIHRTYLNDTPIIINNTSYTKANVTHSHTERTFTIIGF